MIGGLSAKDASGRVQLNLGSLTHVLLKEFLPGAHLGEIGGDRASEIFGGGGLSENGRSRLRELGRILALDVLCNNGDRFPLIWDNRGNPGNLMLARGPGKVRCILLSPVPTTSCDNSDDATAGSVDRQPDPAH